MLAAVYPWPRITKDGSRVCPKFALVTEDSLLVTLHGSVAPVHGYFDGRGFASMSPDNNLSTYSIPVDTVKDSPTATMKAFRGSAWFGALLSLHYSVDCKCSKRYTCMLLHHTAHMTFRAFHSQLQWPPNHAMWQEVRVVLLGLKLPESVMCRVWWFGEGKRAFMYTYTYMFGYSRFRVFSPEYTLHTAITHVIKVRWSLTWIPMA